MLGRTTYRLAGVFLTYWTQNLSGLALAKTMPNWYRPALGVLLICLCAIYKKLRSYFRVLSLRVIYVEVVFQIYCFRCLLTSFQGMRKDLNYSVCKED